jgi:hypothetical protein
MSAFNWFADVIAGLLEQPLIAINGHLSGFLVW